MATLRNKRKLAALVRETKENPRNHQAQKSAAPEIIEDYIAQVSEEIQGRVTKKLSQEIIGTESRILVALSKLDEFLPNPQIRTFSETIPRTFRNIDVENQEPSGDRFQNDSHPEVEFSACRANNLSDSDSDETSHMVTGVQEEIRIATLGHLQANKRKRTPQVSHNSAVRTPLRQLKQTRFCWFLNKWQVTVFLPISSTTLTKYRNCPNPSLTQCLFLMGNQKNSNCLKICCKQV